MYSTPSELLGKARQDGAALVSALSAKDEASVRSALFNFAVTTYHVWDWIKVYRPDLNTPVTHALGLHESLRVCRDLANASQHITIDLERTDYVKHPPTTTEVVVSVMPAHLSASAGPWWRLKIQLPYRRVAAEDFVAEALDAWEQYFVKNSVT